MDKPREFWIYCHMTSEISGYWVSSCQQPAYDKEGLLVAHVIEYSAYQALELKLADTTEYRDRWERMLRQMQALAIERNKKLAVAVEAMRYVHKETGNSVLSEAIKQIEEEK